MDSGFPLLDALIIYLVLFTAFILREAPLSLLRIFCIFYLLYCKTTLAWFHSDLCCKATTDCLCFYMLVNQPSSSKVYVDSNEGQGTLLFNWSSPLMQVNPGILESWSTWKQRRTGWTIKWIKSQPYSVPHGTLVWIPDSLTLSGAEPSQSASNFHFEHYYFDK